MSKITTIRDVPSGGTRQDFELAAARRALHLLKSRIGKQGMIDLLQEDTKTTDQTLRQRPRDGEDGYHKASITLHAEGISAKRFLEWFSNESSNLTVMQAAHPEHFINEGYGLVVETMSGLPSHLELEILHDERDAPPAPIDNRVSSKYPLAVVGRGRWRNGLVGYTCHQFVEDSPSNAEPGFEGCFTVWLPAAFGEGVIEEHSQHLLVEWSNWIEAAYRAVHRQS